MLNSILSVGCLYYFYFSHDSVINRLWALIIGEAILMGISFIRNREYFSLYAVDKVYLRLALLSGLQIMPSTLLLFTFSYLTRGMNMTDMAMLKWKENINDNRIIYVRTKTTNTKKTNEPIIIKIEPEIQNILDRYPRTNDYIFPILQPDLSELTKRYRIKSALKKISKDITDIAKSLNIESADKITHYWARHTYATALKRSGIPIAVISEALCHSSESTTKAYLDKFEQTEIDNTFQFLL